MNDVSSVLYWGLAGGLVLIAMWSFFLGWLVSPTPENRDP